MIRETTAAFLSVNPLDQRQHLSLELVAAVSLPAALAAGQARQLEVETRRPEKSPGHSNGRGRQRGESGGRREESDVSVARAS